MSGVRVVIVWRDESREPLREIVDAVDIDGGLVVLTLSKDKRPPNVVSAHVGIPIDLIETIESQELDGSEEATQRYQESSTFRERPDKSPWFPGVGVKT